MDILKAASELGFNAQLEKGKLSKDDNGRIIDFTELEFEQIEAKALEIQAGIDSTDYQRKRKAEYDALNQFEMLFDLGLAGWKSEIQKIKNKYPKP